MSFKPVVVVDPSGTEVLVGNAVELNDLLGQGYKQKRAARATVKSEPAKQDEKPAAKPADK